MSPPNGQENEENEKVIVFTGPSFAFQGRQVELCGRIRYHSWLTKDVEPDWPIVNDLESELSTWLAKRYKREEGRKTMEELEIFKNMADTPLWSYFTCRTLWGDPESKETKRKMLSFAKYMFLSSLWDEIVEVSTNPTDAGDVLGTAERRQQLFQTCEPMVAKLYGMQFVTKSQLREKYLETEFGGAHPQYLIHIYAVFKYMKEFIASYHLLHPQQVKDSFYTWFKRLVLNPKLVEDVGQQEQERGAAGLEGDDSQQRTTGFVQAGMSISFHLLAMLDQLRLTKVMTQNEDIRKLETLACGIERNLNDLVSAEREILEGKPVNDILIACYQQGLDFQTAVQQHLHKGEILRLKFQNTFDFIMKNYTTKDDAGLRRYAEIVGAATAAFWPNHLHLQRFTKLKISLVPLTNTL